jgi:O-antigen/teichoic acid export membrane protein
VFTSDENIFRGAKAAMLVIYRALSDLAGKGSLFLVTIVAARRLSQQDFGVFSLGSTLGWMVAVATDFGIQVHLARAVARRPASAAHILGRWLRVRLWLAGGAIIAVGLALASGRPGRVRALPILLLALVYVCSGLVEFLHYFYRGLSRSDMESTLTLWQRSATLVCALVALAWRADVTVLAAAMLVPVAATFVASVRIAGRLGRAAQQDRPDNVCRPPADGNPDSPLIAAEFRAEVLPIGAGIVLSALYFRIDVFLLELWSGTGSVALYNAVFRLVEALRLFPAAVLAVALPALCRTSDRRLLVRISLAVMLFAVATTTVLWESAGWLIPLVYGPTYATAVPAFRILLLSFPLLSLNYALTHQLIGWDNQRAYATLCAGALVVNVGLNARLIPALSIDGAAWATLWTEAFLTAGCLLALGTGPARRAPREASAPATQ